MADASQSFYPYPHIVKYNGSVLGMTRGGVAIKFETVKRYVRPLEFQAPTKVFHVAKLPRVVSALMYFSADTAKAAFGKLATGAGASNATAKGIEETSDANTLLIEPEGTKGIRLSVTKAIPDKNSIDALAKDVSWQRISWNTINSGAYNAADWTLTVIGESGAITDRNTEIEKVKTYIKDNYSQSCYIVSKPPSEWLPGLRSPSYFLTTGRVGHPYDDPKIFFVDVEIYIYSINYTDPFGEAAQADNYDALNGILKDLSWDAVQEIATLNMTGRIISTKRPFYDKKKQMCSSSVTLRLYINEG